MKAEGEGIRYNDNDNYIGFGSRVRDGTQRTTIIADVFKITQNVRDTSIHLKVDEEQWRVAQGSERHVGGWGTLANYLSGLGHIS